jgi:hypothetical protein
VELLRSRILEHQKGWQVCKVENILEGCLDLIASPLPSVKIQIMGGKMFYLISQISK